jgi:hypothetical protein
MSDVLSLQTEGYVLWRNAIPQDRVHHAQESINTSKVNYRVILPYIKNDMLPVVNKNLNWSSVYTKSRISDNNNSADASAFHRDVACHHPKKKIFPVYTCLSYLDTTTVEIIPKSHLSPVMTFTEAIQKYNQAIPIKINPGDILLFHAGLIHRGIFSEGLNHRRLIQVFEVYPSQQLMNEYKSRIVHTYNETSRPVGKSFMLLSKNKPIFWIINAMGYLNAAMGYGYYHKPMERASLPYEYCSSEGTQERLKKTDEDGWGKSNVYILMGDHPSMQSNSTSLQFWQYYCQIYLYVFTVLIIFLFVYLMLRNK